MVSPVVGSAPKVVELLTLSVTSALPKLLLVYGVNVLVLLDGAFLDVSGKPVCLVSSGGSGLTVFQCRLRFSARLGTRPPPTIVASDGQNEI